MRKEMAADVVSRYGMSVCRTFSINETCCRYRRQTSNETAVIADWLVKLIWNRRAWGFGWDHKRLYRIYCEPGLRHEVAVSNTYSLESRNKTPISNAKPHRS